MTISLLKATALLLVASATLANEGVKTVRHAYSSSASNSNSFASSFSASGGFGTGDIKDSGDLEGAGSYSGSGTGSYANAVKGGSGFGVGGGFGGAGSFSGSGAGSYANVPNPENVAFWWATPNSPFKEAYEYFKKCSAKGNCADFPVPFPHPGTGNIPSNLPSNGCNDNGCSFSGNFNINDRAQVGSDLGPIDISNNPFLNGEFQGIAYSSCKGNACPGGKPHSTITTTHCKGGDCKTNTEEGQQGTLDLSNNPFLSGVAAGAGAFSSGGCSGVKGGCSGSQSGTAYFGSGFTTSHGKGADIGCDGVKGGCGGTTVQQRGQASFGYNGEKKTTDSFGASSGTNSEFGFTSGIKTTPGSFENRPIPGSSQHGNQPFSANYPGQTGFEYTSGTKSTAGSFETKHPNPTTYPGQQNSFGFTSGTKSTTGSLDTQHYGKDNLPGAQPIPSTYPGQQTGLEFTSGITKTTSGSFQDQYSNKQNQPGPTTYPGQQTGFGYTSATNKATSGSFDAQYPNKQNQPGPTAHPGQQTDFAYTNAANKATSGSFDAQYPNKQNQPGPSDYPEQQTGFGYTSGTNKATSGNFDAQYPNKQNQPGPTAYPGQQTGFAYTSATNKATSGSFDAQYPNKQNQPGPTAYPEQQTGFGFTSATSKGTSGSFESQYPNKQNQPKPFYPEQSGFYTSGTKSTSGSFDSKPIPTAHPGSYQPGVQPVPTNYPDQTYHAKPIDGPARPEVGSFGSQPIPTAHPGQSSFSGSNTVSGSFFGSTKQSQPFPTASGPSYNKPDVTRFGSTASTFGQSGITADSHNQETSGSFSGDRHPSIGVFSGPTPGITADSHSQATSGSFSGAEHPTPGVFGGSDSTSGINGQLIIKCAGYGRVCIKKHLCHNGIVNQNGDGLLQYRDGDQYCDVNTEVCCRLPGYSGQPDKDVPVQVPTGQTYFSTNSHKSSSSSSSASSSSSSSSFITTQHHGSNPTVASNVASRHTPLIPDSNVAGSNIYQPGKTIPFGGNDGTSPGLIHVLPSGEDKPVPQKPEGGLNYYGPGQAPGPKSPNFQPAVKYPGFTHILPNGEVSTPRSHQPGLIHVSSSNDDTVRDIKNDLYYASTAKGPAYLPPGPSPSPSSYSPDLVPPHVPSRPTIYYPSTPRPTTYYPTTPAYIPPSTTKRPYQPSGYLPPNPSPDGSETTGNNNYLPPPEEPEDESKIIHIEVITSPRPPPPDREPDDTNEDKTIIRPTPEYPSTPYAGCAAALKCVPYDFCSADGVISPTRVVLTKEQEVNRVPVTDCKDKETGFIGKCCRDPTYKDPWPASILGQYRPDLLGFDNGQYKENRNDGKYRPVPGVKGSRPNIPVVNRPFEPNQIGSPSGNPNSVLHPGYTDPIPNIPFDSRLVNYPLTANAQPPIEYNYDQKYQTSPSKVSSQTCGVRHPNSRPAGPGPIDASFGEIPWQAMILRDTNRSLLCGGAIIRPNVVLTAAHCVENLQSHDVLVKGGEWKLGIDEEPKPFQINKVAAIVRHPGYNPQTKLNDVALLILHDKFRSDRNVDTLCLPAPGEDVAKTFQGAKCITTGWGKTILQLNILNSIMHILGVGIVPGGQCQQRLQQQHSNLAYLYNTNCICGETVQPQADICDVDIGSALACDRGDGRYTLAGIYSWDTGCNPTAQVAGYAKVDTQWIESTLQRPIKDLRTEESGFYAQLQNPDCDCIPGK